MAQQTAVEWLEEQLNKWSDGRFYLPPHIFEQAKQMEKEQIVDAWMDGNAYQASPKKKALEYYNENYTDKNLNTK